jgi:hypothetical protein
MDMEASEIQAAVRELIREKLSIKLDIQGNMVNIYLYWDGRLFDSASDFVNFPED